MKPLFPVVIWAGERESKTSTKVEIILMHFKILLGDIEKNISQQRKKNLCFDIKTEKVMFFIVCRFF